MSNGAMDTKWLPPNSGHGLLVAWGLLFTLLTLEAPGWKEAYCRLPIRLPTKLLAFPGASLHTLVHQSVEKRESWWRPTPQCEVKVAGQQSGAQRWLPQLLQSCHPVPPTCPVPRTPGLSLSHPLGLRFANSLSDAISQPRFPTPAPCLAHPKHRIPSVARARPRCLLQGRMRW